MYLSTAVLGWGALPQRKAAWLLFCGMVEVGLAEGFEGECCGLFDESGAMNQAYRSRGRKSQGACGRGRWLGDGGCHCGRPGDAGGNAIRYRSRQVGKGCVMRSLKGREETLVFYRVLKGDPMAGITDMVSGRGAEDNLSSCALNGSRKGPRGCQAEQRRGCCSNLSMSTYLCLSYWS